MCIILLLVIYIQQKVTYSDDNLSQTLQNKALSTEIKKKKNLKVLLTGKG